MLIMLAGYILLHDLLGGTLFSHSNWDSYTLQAQAWLDGKLGLGQNYSWLELAIYEGDWYVSFPPFPSVALLPLVLIFGVNTPNNLLIMAYAMATAALCYKSLKKCGAAPLASAFMGIFYVWGSNMFWMSTNGGVWFQAQALNMLLLTAMVYAALCGRRVLAYAFVALAVGCRPFSLLAFLPLFFYFCNADREAGVKGFWPLVKRQLPCLILPACIGGAYMWYNYARFDNPFEFGHNYLPEFTESTYGQFSLQYLGENLKNLFFRPVRMDASGRLSFTYFNSFMFYIANPMFLLLFARVFQDLRKRRMEPMRATLLIAMAANILLLCLHKTLGGWQFGARYTVDLLPLALFYLLLGEKWETKPVARVIMILGIMFNAYGTLAMTYLQ